MAAQGIEQEHNVDDLGNPAGGFTTGVGISITWQNGPLAVDGDRKAPNGAFVEDVIAAAIGRIEHYQSSKFACYDNSCAIEHLQEALKFLERRTADRVARGVEGTHEV